MKEPLQPKGLQRSLIGKRREGLVTPYSQLTYIDFAVRISTIISTYISSDKTTATDGEKLIPPKIPTHFHPML